MSDNFNSNNAKHQRPTLYLVYVRDVLMLLIRENSHVGSLSPTVVYIRINDVFVVLAMLRLVSCISHYSPVTSLVC